MLTCINPLKTKLVYMLFKNSVRTSKRTPHFTITKINWLTLFKFNPLKSKLVYMLFKNSVRTSKTTPHFTITKINWLTLFKFNPLKTKLVYMLFKNSVRTSKRTLHFTITQINWLTLFMFKEDICHTEGKEWKIRNNQELRNVNSNQINFNLIEQPCNTVIRFD
jgi:uncharacterized HAD superfamily protein